MKTKTTVLILFVTILMSIRLKSQDLILKLNGDSIKAKISEVGTNAVSFKKADFPDGPTFVESKSDIILIRYSNGQVQQFNTPGSPSINETAKSNTNIPSVVATGTANNTLSQANDKIKIERDGKKYKINGKKASLKEVDRQLGQSKNPAILLPLKAATIMGKAQKIAKLTSIPTTIGGGFSLLWTGIDLYNDIQRGRAKNYLGVITSFLGTFSLPITSKILKSKSDKMHDKLIDMYNLTN
jgi:hypothetical protein